jgi:two-component system, NarL family, nitrate/nitrite response regulator NarL
VNGRGPVDPRGRSLPVLTVLVADSDAAYCSEVRAALEPHDFAIVGTAATAPLAIEASLRDLPDICLIDLALPGGGLHALAQIARRATSTTVIALTSETDPDDLIASLRRGAAGYLLKGMGAAELAKVLRAAWAGEAAVSRALVPALVEEVRGGSGRELALPTATILLTPRQWEVAEALRDGLQTAAIAQRLGVSPVTVRRHVARLMNAMGAPNRGAAIDALRLYART